MFSYHEWSGQASYHQAGEIQVNEQYYTVVKPAWLIGLKLAGLMAMVAVGYAIAIPSLLGLLPLWQAIVLVAGAMLIYVGIAFFVRPEPNTDNMGLIGGLANDPFQYSDNINRWLWNLHCLLGPGRFAAETLLDGCAWLGIAGGEEVVARGEAESQSLAQPLVYQQTHDLVAAPSDERDAAADFPRAAMSPGRFARR